ncbi:DOMON domain containing protein [Musa troglodytarum]|uniref:DOMON domain containing protein n=1 Tax=Musa troglodytarum TaxID=320322 RepID=A0A9E7I6Y7_9LILI|nr:DOMON domain containing protein [Musa troglodytarum]
MASSPLLFLRILLPVATWDEATASDFDHVYRRPPSPAPGSPVEQEVEEPDPPLGNHVKQPADAISKEKVFPSLETPSLVNEGVCPDTVYEGSDPVGLVNATKLVSDRRRNGVAFIRKNIINPATPLRVIWTMVAQFSEDDLRGVCILSQAIGLFWAVHGLMMFVAWEILLPGGILAASLVHVKFGVTAILLACAQPINAYVHAKRSAEGEISSIQIIWESFHVIVGRSAIVAAVAVLISGMKHFGHSIILVLNFIPTFPFASGIVLFDAATNTSRSLSNMESCRRAELLMLYCSKRKHATDDLREGLEQPKCRSTTQRMESSKHTKLREEGER